MGNAIDTIGGDYLPNPLKQTKSGGAVTSCGLASGAADFSMSVEDTSCGVIIGYRLGLYSIG
jgi:NADPH:quinone reductase-like Zn-dependent oxidoreductase